MVLRFLQYSDLSVGFFHVACMLVHYLVESTVIDRAQDIVVICYIDDGWLVEVVPFHVRRRRRVRRARIPVTIIPFDVFPGTMCVIAVL